MLIRIPFHPLDMWEKVSVSHEFFLKRAVDGSTYESYIPHNGATIKCT